MVWYEYPSNFSNGTSVDGLGSLLQYVDSMVGGQFAAGFVILIFLVSFGVGLLTSAKAGVSVGAFIASIFSIYFWKLGMISPFFVIFFIVILVVGVVMMWLDKYPQA